MVEHRRRIVDDELDVLLGLPGLAVEGPKGVGKTATATQRAVTLIHMDDPAERDLLAADPSRLDRSAEPVLLDEWQHYPTSWDFVRRSASAS